MTSLEDKGRLLLNRLQKFRTPRGYKAGAIRIAAAALRAAGVEEREACAKVADAEEKRIDGFMVQAIEKKRIKFAGYLQAKAEAALDIAVAIRARSTP